MGNNTVSFFNVFPPPQIAGAPAGKKGDEHHNMICCLTPTIKISLKRAFDKIAESVKDVRNGFQAYDCYSGEIETVDIWSEF